MPMKSSRRLALAGIVVAVLAAAAFLVWKQRTPAALAVVEYPVGDGKETPIAIAVGPDGAAWFTLDSVPAVGVVRDGKVARVALKAGSVEPLGIGVDAQGSA